MLIVQYPNGVRVTYNEATRLYLEAGGWSLYTDKKERGGQWVASIQVSAGVTVEAIPACKVEAPPTYNGEAAIRAALDYLEDPRRRGTVGLDLLRGLKRAMSRYNARRAEWRGE